MDRHAEVTIQHEWPDGGTTTAHVQIAANFPDAVAEARMTAVQAFRSALACIEEVTELEDEEE